MKPVCPDGFQWYDMKTCAKSMDSAASKADALTSCKGFNPGATLLMPKTENDQKVMENYLKRIGKVHLSREGPKEKRGPSILAPS